MYGARFHGLPVTVAAIAFALSLTLSHAAWVCRDGRPCAFDCSHGIAAPTSGSTLAVQSHGCCPDTARSTNDRLSLTAGMTCRALSTARIAVTAEPLTIPVMAVGSVPSPLPPLETATAYSFGVGDDPGPPRDGVGRPSIPRAPPITS